MKDFLIQNAEDPDLFGDGNMDVVINNSGHIEIIEGVKKVQMELLKACLTNRVSVDGNNYGSTLSFMIGEKQGTQGNSLVKAIAVSTVEVAIDDYTDQQSVDVPDNEKIYRLSKPIRAKNDANDYTIIIVEASVELESGDQVEVMHQLATH